MINLRFPNDIDKLSSDGNGNDVYVGTDPKRYFKIIVKRLPTGIDKVKELAEKVTSSFDAQLENIKKDPKAALATGVENAEAGAKAIATAVITAPAETISNTFTTAVKTLTPKDIDDSSETIAGIGLPLPNELNESLSHNWEKSTSIAADIAGKIMSTDFFGVSIAKGLAQASNNNVRKPTIDPGYFQDYNGTEPRTFSFTWDFIPRNRPEAEQIRNIIVHLKKYTLPSKSGVAIVMNSPHHFDIQFGNKFFDTMIAMKGLVCTNMEVNYSADGTMQMTEDGMPKFIRLSLSFSERRSLYENDFEYKDIQE